MRWLGGVREKGNRGHMAATRGEGRLRARHGLVGVPWPTTKTGASHTLVLCVTRRALAMPFLEYLATLSSGVIRFCYPKAKIRVQAAWHKASPIIILYIYVLYFLLRPDTDQGPFGPASCTV
jgi:hypothetical protein